MVGPLWCLSEKKVSLFTKKVFIVCFRFRCLQKIKWYSAVAIFLIVGYKIKTQSEVSNLSRNDLNNYNASSFFVRADSTDRISVAKAPLDRWVQSRKTSNHGGKRGDSVDRRKVIRIVKWTPPEKNWVRRLGRIRFETCPTRVPCEYVPQSSYNTSDIVMINAFYLRYQREMPKYRFPRQKWLFYHTEAPRSQRFRFLQRYHDAFNLTLTYSSDADIVQPYGICLPTRANIDRDPSSITPYIRKVYGRMADSAPWLSSRQKDYTSFDIAAGKSRLVAWMASDCTATNKRSDYVALLQRHVHVDIYGTCGNLTCLPKFSVACEKLLQSYKFYLAFENSLCPEYITEKAWLRLRDGVVVPVVLGSAEYEKYLPKHSYIDIRDFSSPRHLADYLKLLDKNDTLYNEYFEWRKDYTCHTGTPGLNSDCNICRHANENIDKTEIAPNIAEFWSFEKCMSPKAFYNGVADINVQLEH